MATLPVDRTSTNASPDQHASDHDELHRLHNVLDGSTVPSTGGGTASALGVAAVVSASGALVVNKHNPVDATSGAKIMTLPTGQAQGSLIIGEKYDLTANTVTLSGSIRGSAGTLVLVLPHETAELIVDAAGSYWPIAEYRTLSSLDTRYTASGIPITGVPTIGSIPVATSTSTAQWTQLGVITQIVVKTVDYTLLPGDEVLFGTGTGNRIGTLPTAPPLGAVCGWKKTTADANTLTIATTGGVTIDGVNATTTPLVLSSAQQAGQAFYDGTGWQIYITASGTSAQPKLKLYKKVTAGIPPSAVANTLGAATVIAPDAPATELVVVALNWGIVAGVVGETVSLVLTITFDDLTTSTITPAGVVGNVTSVTVFNDNTKMNFFKSGRYITSFTAQIQSTIASSTATVVVTVGGFNV